MASAGPYYLASKERDSAILKRNPTYAGSREARFDNIAIQLNEDLRTSIARVDEGQLDYVLTYGSGALDPSGELARAFGPGSPDQRYFNAPSGDVLYLAIPPDAGAEILREVSVRQAIVRALDRPRLADLVGFLPTDQLLTPRTLGYVDRDLAPLDGPDLEGARALMAGRTGSLRMVYPDVCDECRAMADVITENLAAIGLSVRPEAVANPAGEDADLSLWFHWYPGIDPVRFLDFLPTAGLYLELEPEDTELVTRLGFLTGEERVKAAAAIADRWAAERAIMAPIGYGVSREYFSSQVGCQVFPPSIYSVDLVTLCPKNGG
jgi:ABC-type transport system substrate-binding protein